MAGLLLAVPAFGAAPGVSTLYPTNILSTSAWLRVSLTSTGDALPGVWSYWGLTNKSTNAAGWMWTNNIGLMAVSTATHQATTLRGTSYYYHVARATNSGGTNWSSVMVFRTGTVPGTVTPTTVQSVTVDTSDNLKHPTNFFGQNKQLIIDAGFATNNPVYTESDPVAVPMVNGLGTSVTNLQGLVSTQAVMWVAASNEAHEAHTGSVELATHTTYIPGAGTNTTVRVTTNGNERTFLVDVDIEAATSSVSLVSWIATNEVFEGRLDVLETGSVTRTEWNGTNTGLQATLDTLGTGSVTRTEWGGTNLGLQATLDTLGTGKVALTTFNGTNLGLQASLDTLTTGKVSHVDATYTATVAKAASAIQTDTGATGIVAGASDSYNIATKTLTWNTNAAGGGGSGDASAWYTYPASGTVTWVSSSAYDENLVGTEARTKADPPPLAPGGQEWADFGNILAADEQYAVAMSSAQTGSTWALIVTGMVYTVPAGGVVTGAEAQVIYKALGPGGAMTWKGLLCWGGRDDNLWDQWTNSTETYMDGTEDVPVTNIVTTWRFDPVLTSADVAGIQAAVFLDAPAFADGWTCSVDQVTLTLSGTWTNADWQTGPDASGGDFVFSADGVPRFTVSPAGVVTATGNLTANGASVGVISAAVTAVRSDFDAGSNVWTLTKADFDAKSNYWQGASAGFLGSSNQFAKLDGDVGFDCLTTATFTVTGGTPTTGALWTSTGTTGAGEWRGFSKMVLTNPLQNVTNGAHIYVVFAATPELTYGFMSGSSTGIAVTRAGNYLVHSQATFDKCPDTACFQLFVRKNATILKGSGYIESSPTLDEATPQVTALAQAVSGDVFRVSYYFSGAGMTGRLNQANATLAVEELP